MTRARELADQHKTLDVDGGTIKLDGNYPVGTNNVALGDGALDAALTGNSNTGIGSFSLTNNTSGASNTGLGFAALGDTTTGSFNTGIGTSALENNTTAFNNTAVGYQAGYSNTTGVANVIIGFNAGLSGQISPANTIIGFRAGETNNSTNGYNTFVGTYAGYSNTSGYNNTFIGARTGGLAAGYYVTTGSKNTIIGGYSGNQGGLDIRTSNNYIVLSDGDGNYSAYGTGGSWYKADNTTTWSTVSDGRIKENVTPVSGALNKILSLNPVEFDYILSGDSDVSFIAQEYREVFPEQVVEQTAIGEEIKALTNNEPLLGLKTNLVPYLVKAIQEQQETITALTARIEALEA